MIKLKDLLFENDAPNIFVPRRIEGRFERMIKSYIRNGSKGDLNLNIMNLTKLPEMLKDITVDGDFYCGNNNLTSLKFAPSSVGGSFYCSSNELTSLEGAPTNVGRNFDCGFNNLTSLEGAPKSVGGNFWCEANTVKFTEEQVRAECDVKGKVIV